MEFYIFGGEDFEELYNCSGLSAEEWEAQGVKRPYTALLLSALGLILALIYMPFVCVMSTNRFIQLSCYKIMFCLGFIDAITIFIAAFLCGYLNAVGAVYCTRPFLVYFVGVAGVSTWCGSCMLCVILALNRCLDIYLRDWHEALFSGRKTWLWLTMPAIYMLFVAWKETPVFYHSKYAAAFYDPFFGMPVRHTHRFINWTHVINNIVMVALMAVLYFALCLYVFTTNSKMSRTRRRIVVQTLLVCAPFSVASAIYDYMQFFPTAPWVSMVGHTFYMITGGSAGLVYLIFNASLRRALLNTLVYHTKLPLPVFLKMWAASSSVRNLSARLSSSLEAKSKSTQVGQGHQT